MKQKIAAMMVALAAALGAASLDELAQDGNGAYLISSSDDWNALSAVLESGTDTSGKTFRQTKDISTTFMLGTEANPFRGTYDGGGHSLTVSCNDASSPSAPFRRIDGATITGLRVNGTVNGGRHSAGLVGVVDGGTNLIHDCRVSVAVTVDDGYCGGIVGHGRSFRTDLVGCVFDGSLTVGGTTGDNSGTIFGWGDSITVTLKDCIDLSDSIYPIGMGKGTVTMENCYYVRPDKKEGDDTNNRWADRGKRVFTITPSDDVALDLFGAPLNYETAGIRSAEGTAGLFCDDILYAGAGENVKLSLGYTGMGTAPEFLASAGTLNADGDAYALVLPDSGKNVTISTDSWAAVAKLSATLADGKANISFQVAGNVTKDCLDWNMPFLSVTATDLATGATYVAAPGTLSGDTNTAAGAHAVVWNMRAQGIEVSGNVSFTVSYLVMPLYCVIDLSGGTNAESYAVTYLDAEPEGGFTNDLYKTEKLVMRLIGPEASDKQPFYCAVFETTQKQWELVTGGNPSNFKDDADSPMRPVEKVSWNMIRGDADTYDWPNTNAVDATSFLGVLRLKSGLAALDLPTEAQWEYACRAGTTTKYSYGAPPDGDYMWYRDNSTNQTHAVGTKRPNAWDLYDMHGNVWEWCLDLYGWRSNRVLRGGGWYNGADSCTSSGRGDGSPSDEYSYGFRLVRTLSSNLEGERSAEAVAGAERAGTVCSGSTPSYLATGEYFKATLSELGYDVPTDGTPYAVKAYGLPAGLKLKYNAAVTKKVKKGKKTVTVVVKPAKCEWWIEGVPTAALDYETNPPYLVITVGGQAEPYDLPIEVLAQEVTELGTFPLGTAWDAESPLYLPGVTNGWTVSGLPSGLKYTPKLVTKANKKGKKVVSVTTNALPYSVYGKTTAAGLFTVTAKKKKGAYYETMKYRMLVTPKAPDAAVFGDDLTNITTMAYVPVEWDLTGGSRSVATESGTDATGRVPPALPVVSNVVKVTGLPGSVTFASANVYKDKKKTKLKQLGQTIVGTPTKPGTYVVTFTKNVMTGTGKNKKTVAKTAQILWKVVANDAELSLGFNTSGGVVEGGSVGLKYGDLLAFSATSNATVTASGLPAGIKLVRVDGSAGGLAPPGEAVWGFAGFTTKAGTYLVTVTATLNGKTVTQRILLKVGGLPAWAKGTFNGYVRGSGTLAASGEGGSGTPAASNEGESEAGSDMSVASPSGLATITVSSVGKISGKFYEGGTNWVLSAASYTGAARPEASPHQGGSRSVATENFTCSNVVAKYTYKAKEKVKGKLKTVTKSVTRTFALTVAPVPVVPDVSEVPVRGVAALVEGGSPGGLAPPAATTIDAWQNLWGSAYKAAGKRLFYTSKKTPYRTFAVDVYTNDVGEVTFIKKSVDNVEKTGLTCFATLSLKVTPSGAVTATLSYDTGKTKKDKKTKKSVPVIYKPTCSSVAIPTTSADVDLLESGAYLFFAPSAANNFPGFGGWVQVTDHDKVQLWEGGPYWATTNVGAERPEDYGLYFWWGDTTGHRPSSSGKFDFDFSESNPAIYSCRKMKSEGWLTDDGALAPAHDAAHVRWGGAWRMPTYQELLDLVDKCDWSPTTMNGVDGCIVRGRDGYASASIFLPCAGYGHWTSLHDAGSSSSYGLYWSSVPYPYLGDDNAWGLGFNSSNHRTSGYSWEFGRSVRPVQGFTE